VNSKLLGVTGFAIFPAEPIKAIMLIMPYGRQFWSNGYVNGMKSLHNKPLYIAKALHYGGPMWYVVMLQLDLRIFRKLKKLKETWVRFEHTTFGWKALTYHWAIPPQLYFTIL